MPNTYFDSDLTGEQIEAALNAIHGVITPENNGKALAVEDGKIVAKSASEWTDTPVLEPLSVTANGDYTPPAGTDGFNSVHVAVPGGGGGGSTNILSGGSDPTSAQGENGDIYLKYVSSGPNITNVRMVIHGVRTAGSDTQVSEVQLLDSNGNVLPWGSGIAASNGHVFSSSQTAEKAFDNITNDKWYTDSKPTDSDPIWIDFEPDDPIAANTVTGWQWWTGDDSPNRDPISFDLLMSFDGGNTFLKVDSAVAASITTSRNALAYTREITIDDGVISDTYCKVNGAWQNLIGSDIDDVDTGGQVINPLSVTQNGIYNPPSGVDGYAPVTVNVSGGGSKGFEVYAADGSGGARTEHGFLDNQYFSCFFDDNMSSTYTLNGVSATFSTRATGKQQVLATTRDVTNQPVIPNNAFIQREGSVFTVSHGDDGSYVSVVGGWVGYPSGGAIYESAAVGTSNSVTLNSAHETLLIFIGASSNTSGITTVDLNGATYTIENIGNHYGAYGMYTAIEINGNSDTNITVTFPASCWSYVSVIGIDS